MQVVIDIDEDTYKDIKRGKIYTSVRDVPQESVVAIANGKPLHKGHGNLVDISELMDMLCLEDNAYNRDNNVAELITLEEIDRLDVIIPADKAESEESDNNDA